MRLRVWLGHALARRVGQLGRCLGNSCGVGHRLKCQLIRANILSNRPLSLLSGETTPRPMTYVRWCCRVSCSQEDVRQSRTLRVVREHGEAGGGAGRQQLGGRLELQRVLRLSLHLVCAVRHAAVAAVVASQKLVRMRHGSGGACSRSLPLYPWPSDIQLLRRRDRERRLAVA